MIFAAVCLLALVFVYRYVPETKDRDFEQIDTDLQARAPRRGSRGRGCMKPEALAVRA